MRFFVGLVLCAAGLVAPAVRAAAPVVRLEVVDTAGACITRDAVAAALTKRMERRAVTDDAKPLVRLRVREAPSVETDAALEVTMRVLDADGTERGVRIHRGTRPRCTELLDKTVASLALVIDGLPASTDPPPPVASPAPPPAKREPAKAPSPRASREAPPRAAREAPLPPPDPLAVPEPAPVEPRAAPPPPTRPAPPAGESVAQACRSPDLLTFTLPDKMTKEVSQQLAVVWLSSILLCPAAAGFFGDHMVKDVGGSPNAFNTGLVHTLGFYVLALPLAITIVGIPVLWAWGYWVAPVSILAAMDADVRCSKARRRAAGLDPDTDGVEGGTNESIAAVRY